MRRPVINQDMKSVMSKVSGKQGQMACTGTPSMDQQNIPTLAHRIPFQDSIFELKIPDLCLSKNFPVEISLLLLMGSAELFNQDFTFHLLHPVNELGPVLVHPPCAAVTQTSRSITAARQAIARWSFKLLEDMAQRWTLARSTGCGDTIGRCVGMLLRTARRRRHETFRLLSADEQSENYGGNKVENNSQNRDHARDNIF